MQTTFMEAISITLSSMIIVLSTLAVIAIILSSFDKIFKQEEKSQVKTKSVANKVVEENDEEKTVAALVTSIIAAEQAQHTNFHIRSVKRVK